MVRPACFGFNAETAGTNAFQHSDVEHGVHEIAMQEFDQVVSQLEAEGVQVMVHVSEDVEAPDAIFPNNWFSTHEDGKLVLYPMFAANRRRESNAEIISRIRSFCRTSVTDDVRSCAERARFLEGTGSIVFDHFSRIAYAVESPRTTPALFSEVCSRLGYQPFLFHCYDPDGNPVYHTNVVMCMGNRNVVLYADGVPDIERSLLCSKLETSGREIIKIGWKQLVSFCGNMLLLKNSKGDLRMIVSANSWLAFTDDQKSMLLKEARPVVVNIPTIERIGGGGVRCMLAELFVNKTGDGAQ